MIRQQATANRCVRRSFVHPQSGLLMDARVKRAACGDKHGAKCWVAAGAGPEEKREAKSTKGQKNSCKCVV